MELRLILGDQLNGQHSWFDQVDDQVCYCMMEIRSESEYVTHHVQKILGIFAALRQFAAELEAAGHRVIYIRIDDPNNLHTFIDNLRILIDREGITSWAYQEPDEYRLDDLLKRIGPELKVASRMVSSEHFLTSRSDLAHFFEGKKTYLMETFYRALRQKHNILMDGDKPITGQWNYDHENRKKLPKKHTPTPPKCYDKDLSSLLAQINAAGLPHMGSVDAANFIWPTTRQEALDLLDYFLDQLFVHFGTYQDAMAQNYWSIYHSRISFAMNVKMIHPLEVIRKAETYWQDHQETISIAQAEGFIRQILGWREYMRGIYWAQMPAYAGLNHFDASRPLPSWFWTGDTKMNCLSQSIKQSLRHAYAHHIQRLMVTGNFALLAGIHPDEVDQWYLGIYIDAFEWVEITNTRGMSQYADGGIVGTKPYISSASYIHKMGDYCQHCTYNQKARIGESACPFNSLYWHFLDQHQSKLGKNHRMRMMYSVWNKMDADTQASLLTQAQSYLEDLEVL